MPERVPQAFKTIAECLKTPKMTTRPLEKLAGDPKGAPNGLPVSPKRHTSVISLRLFRVLGVFAFSGAPRSKTAPEVPKTASVQPTRPPRCPQAAQEGPQAAQEGPQTSQQAPKTAREHPKTARRSWSPLRKHLPDDNDEYEDDAQGGDEDDNGQYDCFDDVHA